MGATLIKDTFSNIWNNFEPLCSSFIDFKSKLYCEIGYIRSGAKRAQNFWGIKKFEKKILLKILSTLCGKPPKFFSTFENFFPHFDANVEKNYGPNTFGNMWNPFGEKNYFEKMAFCPAKHIEKGPK